MVNSTNKSPFNTTTILSVIIFLVSAVGVGAFYYYSQSGSADEEADKGPVVATVNGEEIYKDDFDSLTGALIEVRNLGSQEDLSNTQQIALNDLIQEALLNQYLEENGVPTSDAEVAQEIKAADAPDNLYNFHFYKKRLLIQKAKLVQGISNIEYFEWYRYLSREADIQMFIDIETSDDSKGEDAEEEEEDEEG